MSLINEMLRNLDARQSPTPGSGDGVVVTREPPRKSWSFLVFLLLAIVAALGAVLVLHEQGLLPTKPTIAVTGFNAAQKKPSVTVNKSQSIRVAKKPATTGITTSAPAPSSNDARITPSAAATAMPVRNEEVVAGETKERTTIQSEQSQSLVRKILETPSDYYAVQLVALSDEQSVLDFAKNIGLQNPIHAPMIVDYHQGHVLLLGTYPTYVSAARARDDWIADNDASINTWVRPIKPLQDAIADANPKAPFATNSRLSPKDPLPDRDRTIHTLLQEAEEALIQERLTEPKGNNAYGKYRHVLRLSPDNPIALAGIEQIVSRYLRQSNEYIDENNLERAKLLAERARYVDGESARVLQLEHRINAHKGDARVASPGQSEKPMIQREARRTEKEVLTEANALLARDALLPARNLLEQYLVSDPESIATVRALCRLYLKIGDVAMAGNLLNRTPNLPALTTLELSAQIQARRGDLEGAILMLEAVRPGFHETSYYALRANLYQQTTRYAEAASLYRRLLDDEPNNSAFWLGLAVCLDAMNSAGALEAFGKARDNGEYDGEVLEYIQERITALSK